MAMTASDLYVNPRILEDAWKELREAKSLAR
jgi:hypothetical protein